MSQDPLFLDLVGISEVMSDLKMTRELLLERDNLKNVAYINYINIYIIIQYYIKWALTLLFLILS